MTSPGLTGQFFHDFEAEYFRSAITFFSQEGYDELSKLFRDLLEARFEQGTDLWTLVQVISDPLEPPAHELSLSRNYPPISATHL